jgi:hypothetical protein
MTNTQAMWFEGNFKEYDADLRRRKGADADTPHRVTYKKLVRSVAHAGVAVLRALGVQLPRASASICFQSVPARDIAIPLV